MCDLRCRGQMYVNKNSVFPQWWDRFVKRLMCPNPVKDCGWVQAAAPTSWGRKIPVFLTGAPSIGSADGVHTWFSRVKHACSKVPWGNGFTDRLQHASRTNEWVLLSHSQNFGASSQDVLADTVSTRNNNKSWSLCNQDTTQVTQGSMVTCCWTCSTNVNKRMKSTPHTSSGHLLLLIIISTQAISNFIDGKHITCYSVTQLCGLPGTPRDVFKIIWLNCNLRIKNIWKSVLRNRIITLLYPEFPRTKMPNSNIVVDSNKT